jgi:uncharacterized phage protein (TIGR02218 family)
MKISTISAKLKAESPTLTRIWKITNGQGSLGFTTFSQDLTIDGLLYKASLGFNPTDIESSVNDPYNMELTSILNENGITAIDLSSGLFDYAGVLVALVDYTNLPSSLTVNPPQHLALFSGKINKISYTEDNYTVELMSKANLLTGKTNWVTSKTCRYRFGDEKCGYDISVQKDTLSVSAPGSDNFHFTSGTSFSDDLYTGSTLTWTTGDNTGQILRVMKSNGQNFFTLTPTVNPIKAGDNFQVVKQCNKTIVDCKKYSNFLNFGGEPDLPGIDQYYSNEAQ